ncbi:MAG: hypothetical protein GTO02_03990, partial [Candidatus Dadabacteria bacterium]|nr:hypothetical protein [Candidatus Dadabacteria bacterium]NIQ13586.1 hypothetical protein [Candidatus Dadabacteria bacterium]
EEKIKESKDKSSSTRDEGMPTTHPNLTSSPHPSISPEVKPTKRPHILHGFTEVIKTGYGNLYVTVNTYDDKPFEVFVQIGKSGYTTMADAEATGRLVSLALRSGIDVKKVVEQLEGIGGSSPVFSEGKLVMSIPDAIATVLRKNFLPEKKTESSNTPVEFIKPFEKTGASSTDIILEACPDCGSHALAFESGCVTCRGCGFSRCS